MKCKIDRLIIKGFKSSKRVVDITFSKEPVSVIYGLNGCGKTTLLRLLHAILDRDEKILDSEKVESITIFYTNKSKKEKTIDIFKREKRTNRNKIEKEMRYNSRNNNINTFISDDFIEISEDMFESYDIYNWDEFDKSELIKTTSILFGVNRGITNSASINTSDIENIIYKELGPFQGRIGIKNFHRVVDRVSYYMNRQSRINRYSNNIFQPAKNHILFDNADMNTIVDIIHSRYSEVRDITSQRVQIALFDTLSLAINPEENNSNYNTLPEDFEELILEGKYRLLEALKETADNKLRNQIINILESDNDKYLLESCSKNDLLSKLLYQMILELKEQEGKLKSINKLKEIFDSQTSQEKELVIEKSGVHIKIDKEQHSLDELSSGEKHLLSFLTVFLIEGNNKNFLIIDEPEISLNIRWQRELLPLLNEISPDSQIIVASHSPSIAKKNTKYLVELI